MRAPPSTVSVLETVFYKHKEIENRMVLHPAIFYTTRDED